MGNSASHGLLNNNITAIIFYLKREIQMTISRKKIFFNLSILPFSLLLAVQVEAVQDVYKYKNKQGVIEFTDERKTDKTPEKHIQIEKRSAEEEALSEQKLDKIMEKDAQLDKRLDHERAIENEHRRKLAEQQALKDKQKAEYQKDDNNNDDDDYYDNGYYDRPGKRPVKPELPGKPVLRPGRPR